MVGPLVTLLVVWLALAVLGVVLQGALWLFWIAVVLFLATLGVSLVRHLRART